MDKHALGEILKAYEAKHASESARVEVANEASRARLADVNRFIDEVIVPELDFLSGTLKSKGHDLVKKDERQNQLAPALNVRIVPAAGRAVDVAFAGDPTTGEFVVGGATSRRITHDRLFTQSAKLEIDKLLLELVTKALGV